MQRRAAASGNLANDGRQVLGGLVKETQDSWRVFRLGDIQGCGDEG